MQDAARKINSSYIPATQWAMNAINNAGKDFAKGFSGNPNQAPDLNNLPQTLGDFAANGAGAGELVSGAGHAASALSAFGHNAHLMPLAVAALGDTEGVASKFGNALRGAGKAVYGASGLVHPDDINEIAPVLDRILSTPATDANYFINQLPLDHAMVQPMAENYLPGVTKTLQNNPQDIARALVQRIVADRMK